MTRLAWFIFPFLLMGIASTLPVPSFDGCSLWAWAAETRRYGNNGMDGRNGRDGQSGRAGRRQTTRAEGSPASFNLIGEDGQDGEDGNAGQSPICGYQPREVRYNLQAAHGSDGGNGGRGGDGGDGGSLTIHYSDQAALQQILVNAQGGRGGRGGRGGPGTAGCRCNSRYWDTQTCTGTPGQADYRCQTHRYYCQDGGYGSNGYPGPDGKNGENGQLALINQLEPLPPEAPSQTRSVRDFATQPVRLSRNLWASRQGAASLLAAGSIVNNTYSEYVGRVEGEVGLEWQAERPLHTVSAIAMTATIQENGELTAEFSDDLWAEYTTHRQADQMTVKVTHMVRASDATRLAWGGTESSNRNLTAVILDLAGESAYLNTQFRLRLKTTDGNPSDDRRLRYTTRYDEIISADLVSLDNNRFTIAMGRLPIDLGTFRQGTYARIELTAIRSLGINSAEQSISWEGRF